MPTEIEDKFRKAGYKPSTPFTPDQIAYLEHHLTSIMLWFKADTIDNEKMGKKIDGLLKEIRSHDNVTEDKGS